MIGERLRELRKKKGLKQYELADILKIEKQNISSYEVDKTDPSDNIKVAIARYFNVSLDYLLGVIDEEVSYYDKRLFLKLPKDISDNDINFLNECVELVEYRKYKNKQNHIN